MRNFFKSTSFKILLAAVVVLLACIIAATPLAGGSSPLTSVLGTVLSPPQKGCA